MGRGDQQEHLAAGALEAPEALTPRRRRRIVEEWIANLDYEQQPYGPREAVHTKHLMREHGPVPTGGFDPMLDLPDDVAERDPGEQLACLVRTYGREIGQGYGLALICEVLAAALTGGVTIPTPEQRNMIINNMLSIIIDPAATGDAARFHDEVRAIVDWVCASPPAPGIDRVLVPGDPERAIRAKRLAEGIPVDPETWREIVEAGASVGVAREVLNPAA